MSWSTASNGHFGVLEEPHRIGINFDVLQEKNSIVDIEASLTRLYQLSVRHFIFQIKANGKAFDNSTCVTRLVGFLKLAKSLSNTRNVLNDAALFITLVCDITDSAFIATIMNTVFSESEAADVNCVVVDFTTSLSADPLSSSSSNFAASIAKVPQISDFLLSVRDVMLNGASKASGGTPDRSTAILGIDGIYDRGVLQLLFEEPAGKYIQLVLPGECKLPNIRARVIDFVHSRAANTLHLLNDHMLLNYAKSEEQAPALFPLLAKYPLCKNHPAPLIIKYLVQCGIIVGVSATLGLPFIEEMVLLLIHPFVNRKEFVSPSIIKRFVIDQCDVEKLLAESEEVECREDGTFKTYLHTIPRRVLTDRLPNK